MAHINHKECEKAGIDPDAVIPIARAIQRWVNLANELGLTVFGGSCGGSLRYSDDPNKGDLIVAEMGGQWDGGAGNCWEREDGYVRGEHHND